MVWYDEFHNKYFTKWQSKTRREWRDIDTLRLTAFFQRDLGMEKIGDETVYKAVQMYAQQFTCNEPKDWMELLQWDGKERKAT